MLANRSFRAIAIGWLFVCAPALADEPEPGQSNAAEIRVVDDETGRGIPLAELETVNAVRFVTDNAGRVALREPNLVGKEIFFFVRSHGYSMPKDGFGFAGVRLTPIAGEVSEIRLRRQNIAVRLCRLTGQGLYRDTLLLGHELPRPASPHPGRVAGQDSIQAAVLGETVYWFWGDTLRLSYPLGLFGTAGATTSLADLNDPQFDVSRGLPYDYFVDETTGFARAMMPLPERPNGVIWIDGVCTAADEKGTMRLLAHYSRRKGLSDELEHGIAIFDPDRNIFEPARQLDLSEKWRHPAGHSITHEDDGKTWIYFGNPAPNVRVPADVDSLLNPSRYEAFTCGNSDGDDTTPDLTADGKPNWRWQQKLPPTDSKTEQAWFKSGALSAESARFLPANTAAPDQRIQLHNGTVRWNEHRKCWVMIAGQLYGTSMLGEIWYAEAENVTGPYRRAVKIATHDQQTFYNVCHHAFLDRSNGRYIHLEGTYTNDFSGNPEKTPRYNYNQVLYRLDLDRTELDGARISQ